jgi:hypothetical protein
MSADFLSPIENAFLRWLMSSPRVGLIAVKQFGADEVYVAQDASDPSFIDFTDEPPSMALERLFHMPAHGEDE